MNHFDQRSTHDARRVKGLSTIILIIAILHAYPVHPNEIPTTKDKPPPAKLIQVGQQIFLGIIPRPPAKEHFTDFQLVIDLRYPYEGVYDERGMLRSLGIGHINIPTSSGRLVHSTVVGLAQELAENSNKKILIHDSNGHRSAMLWAANVVRKGGDVEDALLTVEPFFASDELRTKLERYREELPHQTTDPVGPSL